MASALLSAKDKLEIKNKLKTKVMRVNMRSIYSKAAWLATLVWGLFALVPARAHDLAEIELRTTLHHNQVQGEMRLSFHELDQWTKLPRDQNDHVQVQKIQAIRPALESYLQQFLRLRAGSPAQACHLTLQDLLVDDIASLQATVAFDCPQSPRQMTLQTGLFVGSHHDYTLDWHIDDQGKSQHLYLDRRHNSQSVDLDAQSTSASAHSQQSSWLIVIGALLLLLGFIGVALWTTLRSRAPKSKAE